jgi:peroxiredoxin Q/BCP
MRLRDVPVRAARLAITFLIGACFPVARPDGGKGLLPAGAIAPEVTGSAADGRPTSLAAVRGQIAVVYFYPKDETPGCTHEACAFRDTFKKYEERHVAIFGVSRDSDASHKEFRSNHALPFALVADEDGRIARAYGVPGAFGMSSRVTFLVGRDGRIARVWPNVDPSFHADEVLAAVDAAERP